MVTSRRKDVTVEKRGDFVEAGLEIHIFFSIKMEYATHKDDDLIIAQGWQESWVVHGWWLLNKTKKSWVDGSKSDGNRKVVFFLVWIVVNSRGNK